MMYLIAQIFGFLGLSFVFLCLQQNKKNKVLFYQFLANSSYLIQYLFLKAISGVFSCFIATIRSFVFSNYTSKNKEIPFYVFLVFAFLSTFLGYFSYKTIIDIIPIICAIVYTYGVWQSNLKIFRISSAFVSILWFIYNYVYFAYFAMFASMAEFIITVISIYRFDIKKTRKISK